MDQYRTIKLMCEKLWDSEDPDCLNAEDYGFKEQIIELFADCYDYEDFCKWLAKNDCNPANHFRNATIEYRGDCEDEREWEALCEDSLFYNDEFACMQW